MKVESPTKMTQWLATLQKSTGLTQAELSRRLGIQAPHLNAFLRNKSDIRSQLFVRLLRELGVDLEQHVLSQVRQNLGDANLRKTPLDVFRELVGELDEYDRRSLVRYLQTFFVSHLGQDAAVKAKQLRGLK